jgi:hypothetical protein
VNPFNFINIVYWTLLAVVILTETYLVNERWPEAKRWKLGYVTLFGSTLGLVVWHGWDYRAWAGLAVAVAISRLIKIDQLLLGDLWQRRESHRWTVQYFLAFLSVVPLTICCGFDVVTWAQMFFSLGICGASKVGFEAWRDSKRSQEIRDKRPEGADAISE